MGTGWIDFKKLHHFIKLALIADQNNNSFETKGYENKSEEN